MASGWRSWRSRTRRRRRRAVAAIEVRDLAVSNVERKQVARTPAPPFSTSTMQQEASRKLGFSADRTMRTAQRLFEGVDLGGETVGLITYMRTDSVSLSSEALAATRRLVVERYGESYAPPQPRQHKTKSKSAQEAHEAIRPTDPFRSPPGHDPSPRRRSAPALRADLEAHGGEPDGGGAARPRDGRHRRCRRRRRSSRHGPDGGLRRFFQALPGRARRPAGESRRGRGREAPPAGPGVGRSARQGRGHARASTSPSRRPATARRHWSRSWRSWASAGPRPMRASSPSCRTATM